MQVCLCVHAYMCTCVCNVGLACYLWFELPVIIVIVLYTWIFSKCMYFMFEFCTARQALFLCQKFALHKSFIIIIIYYVWSWKALNGYITARVFNPVYMQTILKGGVLVCFTIAVYVCMFQITCVRIGDIFNIGKVCFISLWIWLMNNVHIFGINN